MQTFAPKSTPVQDVESASSPEPQRSDSRGSVTRSILDLQRAIGNQVVQRIVAVKAVHREKDLTAIGVAPARASDALARRAIYAFPVDARIARQNTPPTQSSQSLAERVVNMRSLLEGTILGSTATQAEQANTIIRERCQPRPLQGVVRPRDGVMGCRRRSGRLAAACITRARVKCLPSRLASKSGTNPKEATIENP